MLGKIANKPKLLAHMFCLVGGDARRYDTIRDNKGVERRGHSTAVQLISFDYEMDDLSSEFGVRGINQMVHRALHLWLKINNARHW
jgi:hypothetical protein